MKIRSKYFFIISKHNDFDDLLSFDFDKCLEKTIELIEESKSEWVKPIVIINKTISQCINNKIFIKYDKNYRLLFMLFKHELLHLLIRRYWGIAPALFWEGIPIYYSDYSYYLSEKKVSYHEICKTLLMKNKLITISDIIKSTFFYSNREDIRIDIQTGSFIGFLIEKFGIKNIKEIYQYYIPPTLQKPICNIFVVIKKVFNNDIEQLEKLWIDFLSNVEILNKKYYTQFYNRDYSKKIKKVNICKFCYTPLDNKQQCFSCRKNNSINIEYKREI